MRGQGGPVDGREAEAGRPGRADGFGRKVYAFCYVCRRLGRDPEHTWQEHKEMHGGTGA